MRISRLKTDYQVFVRRADTRITQLRHVIERVQRGEEVDVAAELGTGIPREEQAWKELFDGFRKEQQDWQEKAEQIDRQSPEERENTQASQKEERTKKYKGTFL